MIIREAEAAFPGKQIYGLIGGFHLFRSEDQEVRELADRIIGQGTEQAAPMTREDMLRLLEIQT